MDAKEPSPPSDRQGPRPRPESESSQPAPNAPQQPDQVPQRSPTRFGPPKRVPYVRG